MGGRHSAQARIRYGSQTYAYSYRLDDDFAAYFAWWSQVFDGPAR